MPISFSLEKEKEMKFCILRMLAKERKRKTVVVRNGSLKHARISRSEFWVQKLPQRSAEYFGLFSLEKSFDGVEKKYSRVIPVYVRTRYTVSPCEHFYKNARKTLAFSGCSRKLRLWIKECSRFLKKGTRTFFEEKLPNLL